MNKSFLGYPKARSFDSQTSRFPQRWGVRNFPFDADRVSATYAANTVFTVNLPTNLAKGDILLGLLGKSASAVSHDLSTFTALSAYAVSGTGGGSVWYRVVDGTEGATVTATLGASVALESVIWRVANGFTGAAPKIAAGAATRNPPLLTMGRGQIPTLWFRMGIIGVALVSDPGWSNLVDINGVGGDSMQLMAESLDPPTISGSSSNSRAYTVGIAGKDTPVY